MSNINDIAAEWNDIVEEIYAPVSGAADEHLSDDDYTAELEACSEEERVAWAAFVCDNELFDVDAMTDYFGKSVRDHLEEYYAEAEADAAEIIRKIGESYARSLPNAEIRDGVYALMDWDALNDHIDAAVRERLSNGNYDCDTAYRTR